MSRRRAALAVLSAVVAVLATALWAPGVGSKPAQQGRPKASHPSLADSAKNKDLGALAIKAGKDPSTIRRNAPAAKEEPDGKRPPGGDLRNRFGPQLEQFRRRRAERKERRSRPQEREARQRSRSRHRHKSRAAALGLARDSFPEAVERPIWEPLKLGAGERVASLPSDFGAVVERRSANGPPQRSLVQSTVPLRSSLGDGKPGLVDLSLERSDRGFEPRNPAVPTQLGNRPTDAVTVGDIKVRAGTRADAPQISGDKVFHANLGGKEADTDLLVKPEPVGAQVAWQLRSARSAERLPLSLDLPAGAKLRLRERTGGAEVIAANGKRLASITPPVVEDAEGESVNARYRVDGSTLVTEVEHRGRDFLYPLLVDPTLVAEHHLTDSNNQPVQNCSGWWSGSGWKPYTVGVRGGSWFNFAEACEGLYIATVAGRPYDWGNWAEWYQVAPNKAYIERMHQYASHAPSSSCLLTGAYSFERNNWEPGQWHHAAGYLPRTGTPPPVDYSVNPPYRYANPTSPWFWDLDDAHGGRYRYRPEYRGNSCVSHHFNHKDHQFSSPTRTNAAVFGLWSAGTPGRAPAAGLLRGATLLLNDRDVPHVPASFPGLPANPYHTVAPPSKWVHRFNASTVVGATDTFDTVTNRNDSHGLGMKYLTFVWPHPGGRAFTTHDYQQAQHPCTGSRPEGRRRGAQYGACPRDWAAGFAYSTDDMDPNRAGAQPLQEGVSKLEVVPQDVTTKHPSSWPNWNLQVDRSAPRDFTPTGTLAAEAGDFISKDNYTLDVTGKDDHSGVASISYALHKGDVNGPVADTGARGFENPSCDPGKGCSKELARSFNVDTSRLTEDGRYTVEVVVKDQLGDDATHGAQHVRRKTFSIEVDRVAPTASATHDGINPPRWLGDDKPITSTVTGREPAGSGIKEFRVEFPGGPPDVRARACSGIGASRCAETDSEAFSYRSNRERFPEGPSEVRATVKDAVGRMSAPLRWPVRVDRAAPALASSGIPTEQAWTADEYPLLIRGADGAQRSGAKTVSYTLTSKAAGSVLRSGTHSAPGCSDECPETLEHTFSLRPAPLSDGTPAVPDGDYRLETKTTDVVGHARSASLDVTIDRDRPSVDSLTITPNDWVNDNAGMQGTVAATNPGTGVRSLTLGFPTGASETAERSCQALATPRCQQSESETFSFPADTTRFAEGRSPVTATATDPLGRTSAPRSADVRVDRSPPALSVTGALRSERFLKAGAYSMQIVASDGESQAMRPDLERSGVKRIDVYVDGVKKSAQPDAACMPHSCTRSLPFTLDAGDAQLSEGQHTIKVEAVDQLDHRAVEQWDVVVDRGKPAPVELSGTLKLAAERNIPLVAGPYTLTADARDGDDAQPETRRSGLRSIRVLVDGAEQEPRAARQDCPAPKTSCPMQRTYIFRAEDLSPGEHEVKVVSADHFGEAQTAPGGQADPAHQDIKTFRVSVGPGLRLTSDKLGLEDFWHYDSTDTGAGTQAHTNLATGNLVWHSVPIKNPGRGLSTVVNLTYNSQAGFDALSDIYPNLQTGRNFSLGVSGLTRINEPLKDLGAIVAFTDPDGTRHDFTLSTDGVTYKPPPGVNLHLRRYGPDLGGDGRPIGLANLLNFKKYWAITQPNGVTHFFDLRGYQTSIEDRNGNELRFDYEALNTGLDCPLVVDVVCRVQRIVDPGGRALEIDYNELTELPPVNLNFDEKTRWLASLLKVNTITDHAGRVTKFDYNLPDQLDKVTQAYGTPDARVWDFSYRNPAGTNPLEERASELIGVTDPRGNKTEFDYERVVPELPPRQLNPAALWRVSKVEDRRDHATDFDWETVDDDNDGNTETTVTDARDAQTLHEIDGQSRLSEMRGPLEQPIERTTRLAWDADNNVKALTKAAGSPDEATTRMTYNPNGMLSEQTDPEGHVTKLRYRDGIGRHPTPLFSPTELPLDPSRSADADESFVSDLIRHETPRGFATTYTPDERGNVTSRIDGAGHRGETDYDPSGQITAERAFDNGIDKPPNVTRYEDYDPSGLPRRRIDARNHSWHYSYDPVGNVTRMADPRGGTEGNAFATRLTYNAFDQLTREIRPKRSEQGEFVTRDWEFDRNGNEAAKVDGERQRWETDYSDTDKPELKTSPAARHFDEDDPAPEVTELQYDDEDNLTRQISPNGKHEGGGSWETELSYDLLGRRTTTERQSSSDEPGTLASSQAYDRRDNVIGMADPNANARCPGSPAENAANAACRRSTYGYDRADNRTTEVEDPGQLALTTTTTFDANDNPTVKTDPRRNPWKTEYDGADRPVAQIDPLGRRRETKRRADGKVEDEISPKGTASAAAGDYTTHHAYLPTGELASRSLPRAAGQYGPGDLKVSYTRDEVGNPTTITDARRNSFENTFYDSGELRTTQRPSWWKVEGGKAPQEKSAQELLRQPEQEQLPDSKGKGDLGEVKPQQMPDWLPKAGDTSFAYDGEMRLEEVTDERSQTSKLGRDELGRVSSTSRPYKSGQPIVNRFEYDRNANMRRSIDGEGSNFEEEGGECDADCVEAGRDKFATVITYDQFDRAIRESRPGQSTGRETTNKTLDANGNVTEVETPRGSDTQALGDFTEKKTYDRVDRLSTEANPARDTTAYRYDENGNRTLERSPRGQALPEGDAERPKFETTQRYDDANQLIEKRNGLGHEWLYGYDRNGNKDREDAPGSRHEPGAAIERQVTTREFEGRDLPWTETTDGSVAGGANQARTTVTEFDPNANLRREVNPAGVKESNKRPEHADSADDQLGSGDATTNATVHEHNEENLKTATWEPRGTADAEDRKRYRQLFEHDSRGRVCGIVAPEESHKQQPGQRCQEDSDKDTHKTLYKHYETGWVSESKDPTHQNSAFKRQTITYDYDLRGNQTQWRSNSGGTAHDREIRRSYFANGKLQGRTAEGKPGAGATRPDRRYLYEYNPNGSMTKMTDRDKDRVTVFQRDAAEREAVTDERWSRQGSRPAGKDTVQSFDRNGNVRLRRTDGDWSADDFDPDTYAEAANYSDDEGKTSSYRYDQVDRESEVDVDPAAAGERTRRTNTTYYDSGEKQTRSKNQLGDSDAAVVDSWFHFSDGRPSRAQRTRRGSGELQKNQSYHYDRNGNRSRDERGEHGFNSRDQHVRWKRRSDSSLGSKSGQQASYKLNGSGAMTEKTDGTDTTKFVYDGDRLECSVQNGGTPQSFSYDEFGSVTSGGGAAGAGGTGGGTGGESGGGSGGESGGGSGAGGGSGGSADCQGASSEGGTGYQYDEFGRMKKGTAPDGKTVSYDYDGLDRRDSQTDQAGKLTDHSYVGSSEQLSQEKAGEGSSAETRSYDYDSDGERLGQSKGGGANPPEYKSYAKDANGSTEGLEESGGQVQDANKYDYDPYGEQERRPAEGSAAQGNPFRFEGFYEDEAIKTYDMEARPYRPELGRFLTQDRFEDSKGDLNLQSDPLTQNRYAFAGGNPVNRIEWDGHTIFEDVGNAAEDVGDAVSKIDPSKAAHTALDVGGLVPGVGEVADLANAGIYAAEGNKTDAALSLGAAVPGAGYFANAAKAGRKLDKAADGTKAAGAKAPKPKAKPEPGQGAETKGTRVPGGCGGGRGPNSFTSSTPVLRSDGRRVAISKLTVGQWVLATDPKSGRTVARRIERVITGQGRKTLVRIRIDGKVTTATDRHPFWVVNRARWVDAEDLRAGDRLREPDGELATVEGLRVVRVQLAQVYNLSVSEVHTYYAGAQLVLVHNANKKGCGGESLETAAGRRAHEEEPMPPGFEPEVRLPSGRKMDGYNRETREVLERKPDNPRAMRDGKKQAEKYCRECDDEIGGGHTSKVVPYNQKKYLRRERRIQAQTKALSKIRSLLSRK